jgi:hypothetical protein
MFYESARAHGGVGKSSRLSFGSVRCAITAWEMFCIEWSLKEVRIIASLSTCSCVKMRQFPEVLRFHALVLAHRRSMKRVEAQKIAIFGWKGGGHQLLVPTRFSHLDRATKAASCIRMS